MTRGFPEPGDFDQRDYFERADDERERRDRFLPIDWSEPMAEDTKIQLADHTWNPWLCIHDKRRRTSDANWKKPLAWNRDAEPVATRLRVFPSMDPFEDWQGSIVNAKDETPMDQLRRDMFGLIDQTPNLDYILATKRPENAGRATYGWPTTWMPYSKSDGSTGVCRRVDNVWLLYSASDQESLEAGIGHLLKCRDLVPVLGLSLEPLVGPIDDLFCDTHDWQCPYCSSRNIEADIATSEGNRWFCDDCGAGAMNDVQPLIKFTTQIDWVIVGGDSGPGARPCQMEWIESIVQQCKAAGVPCFVKQLGSFAVTSNVNIWEICPPFASEWGSYAAGAKLAFKHPKGGDPSEWPEPLQVQECPT